MTGYVRDRVTGEPLRFAHVYTTIDGVIVGAVTGADGGYLLDLPGPDRMVTLTASYVGYIPQSVEVHSGAGVQYFELSPGVDLPEVEIFPEDNSGGWFAGLVGLAVVGLLLAQKKKRRRIGSR